MRLFEKHLPLEVVCRDLSFFESPVAHSVKMNPGYSIDLPSCVSVLKVVVLINASKNAKDHITILVLFCKFLHKSSKIILAVDMFIGGQISICHFQRLNFIRGGSMNK